jgi:flagellar hook-associated protein 3 FlgL
MIGRVTENIKFSMLTNNMFKIQSEYGQLMEKLSTQKMINSPSDDPIGTNDILDFRTITNTIEQYQSNITDANIYLNLSSTNLSGLRNIVNAAKSMAISESGASADHETRQASAATLTSLIDEALSLLNTKNGDNYLFGGSSTNIQPFSSTYTLASVGVAFAATTNSFNGAVISGGTYTATENKNYAVKIVEEGTLATASYQVSSDGGKTWGTLQTGLSAPVTLGDGITLSFTAGSQNLAADDTFTVNGYAAGYYRGNNDKLNAVIGNNYNMSYNITGAEAFTGQFASGLVINLGTGITDGSIELTRDATDWHITGRTGYTAAMVITSQTVDTMTIDADGNGTDDIKLNLTGAWNKDNKINFSTTAGITSGEIPVTFSGSRSVDLLSSLNALKTALSETDPDRAEKLIAAQIDNLENTGTQLLQYETQIGAKMDSLETTSNNHKATDLQITNMLADIENADLTKLIMEFQMKQIAMQASYSMASQISKMTIMDYIR